MTVQLLFSTTRNPFSWIIRFFTFSDFSHVSITKDGVLWEAIALNGVIKQSVTKYTTKRSKWLSRVDTYELIDFPEESWTTVQKFLEEQLGKGYDWKGIFGYGLRKEGYEDSNRWFCSEYIAIALKKAGFPLVNDYSWRVTPRDLRISLRLKFVSSWKK